jgi:hypothetical protein
MTFLSVPGKYREFHAQEAAPEGTFGFVHLYLMFSGGYDLRPAISLDTRGPILNYYYWSAIRLFNEGVEQGFLQPVKLAAKSVEAG